MIKALVLTMLVGYVSLCFATDESKEPPLKYKLKINGKVNELVLDNAVTLKGNYRDPEITLHASDTRRFTYGNIAFKYPASFTWEADIESDKERSWILSGNDFKIMYFVQPEHLTIDSYALSMANQFGKENTRISDTDREFGGRKLKGKLLFVKLAGIGLTIEVYALSTKSGSRLLVLQDNPSDNRMISKEGEGALKLLSESFIDKEAAKSGGAGGV